MGSQAWFNGDGVETWQNIWGIWQGLTRRDAAALQRLGPLLRFFGRSRGFLQSSRWVPHAPGLVHSADVFASAWPLGPETLWSVVNRGTADRSGPQLVVQSSDTRSYYDCYHGVRLPVSEGHVSFEVQAGGFGCVLATPNKTLSADTDALLRRMRALTEGSKLNSFSKTWEVLRQTMVPIPSTKPHVHPPVGMVTIPAVANYTFVAYGVEIEGQTNTPMAAARNGSHGAMGVDVQFPCECTSRSRPIVYEYMHAPAPWHEYPCRHRQTYMGIVQPIRSSDHDDHDDHVTGVVRPTHGVRFPAQGRGCRLLTTST